MLTYKNVNLRHATRVIFDWHQAFNNCDCERHIKRRGLYCEAESYESYHLSFDFTI